MSLYVHARRHTLGLPLWFVPFYAMGWLLFATLAIVVWLIVAIAVRAVLLFEYLRLDRATDKAASAGH